MNRFQAPSNLSHRERNTSSYASGSTLTATPPMSGRSSPYQPYGSALGGQASSSGSSLHSSYVAGGNGRDSLPRWQGSAQRSAEQLESQNDEAIEGIGAKVKLLKDLAIGIGKEARDSTIQLTEMNDAFAETSGILGGTFRRMNAMAKRQGGRWVCYMLFLVLVFWFFIVVWFFRR